MTHYHWDHIQGLPFFEPAFRSENRFHIYTVRTVRLAHPNGALGYRFDSQQGSFCFVTDHEHPAEGLSESVVDFVRGATILIHDAQYTPEEKGGARADWGHSSWEEAALTAREGEVKCLFLIHHDPDRVDKDVADILYKAQKVFSDTELATEGSVYDFEGDRLLE